MINVRWGVFFLVAGLIVVIILFQWPKIKQAPKKDKWALFILFFIAWGLSLFNLQYIEGPNSILEKLLDPTFGKFMKK
ncbi:hypothetical protein ACFFF5_16395 [Lederbergia wuyishanensis]|uniref:hypothetical protein n=1 Tax=Lederbergia wuyishanensis TaxID=1347903 RepID=UPI001FD548A1|nr:hypothetical protein [Lederbergia wuyishanensis]MCJ8008317.1 hypothetical protein [Lederbergia wuyishanensis]